MDITSVTDGGMMILMMALPVITYALNTATSLVVIVLDRESYPTP